MKTFEEIYENIINKNGEELNIAFNELKDKDENIKIVGLIICIIINILYVLLIKNKNILSLVFLVFIDIFIIIATITISQFSKEYKKYLKIYKEKVIKSIIDNFYDDVEYFPFNMLPEKTYLESNCMNYDTYYSEDYFKGTINNKNKIEMAEVTTKEIRKYKDSDGEEQEKEIIIFSGLFSKIELGKSINNELEIYRNNNSEIFKKNKVEMDSSEFEKNFDVNCTNKIVAMEILTSDVMEELLRFKENSNIEFSIRIKNDKLYLKFICGDMFEIGKLKKGSLDKELLEKFFNILKFTNNLSSKLIQIIEETEI